MINPDYAWHYPYECAYQYINIKTKEIVASIYVASEDLLVVSCFDKYKKFLTLDGAQEWIEQEVNRSLSSSYIASSARKKPEGPVWELLESSKHRNLWRYSAINGNYATINISVISGTTLFYTTDKDTSVTIRYQNLKDPNMDITDFKRKLEEFVCST